MTLQEAQSFVQAVLAQQKLNREAHGDSDADDQRKPLDWGIIGAEHMGHLIGALRCGDEQVIEKEILHVVGPLLECWNTVKTSVKQVSEYECPKCNERFTLTEANDKCPLCESKLKKIQEK